MRDIVKIVKMNKTPADNPFSKKQIDKLVMSTIVVIFLPNQFVNVYIAALEQTF